MDSDKSAHARSPPRLINPLVNMDSSYCRHLASGDVAAGGSRCREWRRQHWWRTRPRRVQEWCPLTVAALIMDDAGVICNYHSFPYLLLWSISISKTIVRNQCGILC
jgi:hypothetical protein